MPVRVCVCVGAHIVRHFRTTRTTIDETAVVAAAHAKEVSAAAAAADVAVNVR